MVTLSICKLESRAAALARGQSTLPSTLRDIACGYYSVRQNFYSTLLRLNGATGSCDAHFVARTSP